MAGKKPKKKTKGTSSTTQKSVKEAKKRSNKESKKADTDSESEDNSEPAMKRMKGPSKSTPTSTKNDRPSSLNPQIAIDDILFEVYDKPVTLRVCITTGQKKAVFSDNWYIEKVNGLEASSEWKDVETTIGEALESHGGSIKYERLVDSHGNSLYTHHPDFLKIISLTNLKIIRTRH
jgi:hypothetical protein